jgi:hypothetical protein
VSVHYEAQLLEHCRGAFRQISILKHSTAQHDLLQRRLRGHFEDPIHQRIVKARCDSGNGQSLTTASSWRTEAAGD